MEWMLQDLICDSVGLNYGPENISLDLGTPEYYILIKLLVLVLVFYSFYTYIYFLSRLRYKTNKKIQNFSYFYKNKTASNDIPIIFIKMHIEGIKKFPFSY